MVSLASLVARVPRLQQFLCMPVVVGVSQGMNFDTPNLIETV